MTTYRIIGPGRAGSSLAAALDAAGGWDHRGMLGRDDDLRGAARDVELLVVATPDDVIAQVAASVDPVEATVVVHLAGSRGLEVLAPHVRRGAVHPLMTLPDSQTGAPRLRGAWFAVAGDPLVDAIVRSLQGRSFSVRDDQRATYHATACVAANHLVALFGQVERLAGAAGVPFEAFFDIARAALDNVERLGPAAAVTGPVARGDIDTIARHLAAIPDAERAGYEAMVAEARRLVA